MTFLIPPSGLAGLFIPANVREAPKPVMELPYLVTIPEEAASCTLHQGGSLLITALTRSHTTPFYCMLLYPVAQTQ